MFAQPTHQHRNHRVVAALVMTLVGVGFAPRAFAPIKTDDRGGTLISSSAIVTDYGRHLMVTGPMSCTKGEWAYLRVTVTQRATGAVAEGRTRLPCTGDPQPWEVHASIQDTATFQCQRRC